MKNVTLALAVLLFSAFSVFAQGGSYRVDNFDFANAVKIATPPSPAPKPLVKQRGKRLVTARNFEYAPSNLPMVRTTSMDVTPLSGFTTGDANIAATSNC